MKTYIEIATEMVNRSGYSFELLATKSRKRELVLTRQSIFYVLITNSMCSLGMAGALFNRDHATVLHAKTTVTNILDTKYPHTEYSIITNLIEHYYAITAYSCVPKMQGRGHSRQTISRIAYRNQLGNYSVLGMPRRQGYATANSYNPYAIARAHISKKVTI